MISQRRIVLGLALLVSLWFAWGYDLWAPDEPYFGEGAREMVVDGQWAVPHVNGEITTDKPPLFFWLIAIFSLPFGAVSSLTARLPSILAFVGSVALIMRLGRRWWDEGTACLAGLVFATMYLPWDKGRTAQIDALLCVLILVAVSAFESLILPGNRDDQRARPSEDRGAGPESHTHGAGVVPDARAAGLLFWFASALAVIAKGPVGLLLPLGVALAALLFERRLSLWRRFAPLAGPIVFLLVVAAWIAFATIGSHGEYSVWGAFKQHFLERGLSGMHHRQPPWYYAQVLPGDLMPWTAFVLPALFIAWRRRRDPVMRFLMVWAAFVVLFFTVSTEKRDLYVLPAYPAFALLTARFIRSIPVRPTRTRGMPADSPPARDTEQEPSRLWGLVPLWITGVLFAGLGVVLPIVVRIRFPQYFALALPLACVMLAGGVFVVIQAARGAVRAGAHAVAGTMAVLTLVAVTVVYPALDPIKSAGALARQMRDLTTDYRAGGHRILAFDIGNVTRQLSFYSDGVYFDETSKSSELEARIGSDAEMFGVAGSGSLDGLPAELRERVRIVASAPRLESGKLVLFTNRPAP